MTKPNPFLTDSEIEQLRETFKIASEQARDACRDVGVQLHPKVAKALLTAEQFAAYKKGLAKKK